MSVDAEYTLAGGTAPEPEPTTGAGSAIGSGLTDPAGAALGMVEDHCAEAIARLLHQFHGKTRLENLVCVFGDQVQAAEVAFWELFTERTLAAAVDAQLDGIGDIVGEPRKGRTDAVYRTAIRVKILANRSDGKVETLYLIVLTALGAGTVVTIDESDMALHVVIDTAMVDFTAAEMFYFLRLAKMDGVRLEMTYTFSDPGEGFTFDDDTTPGPEDNAQGFGSTTDASWGGELSSAIG